MIVLFTGGSWGRAQIMALQAGDWVRTLSGDVGKVVHISRLTVFVAFPVPGKADRILAFLESELTKTDSPSETTPTKPPDSLKQK